MKLFYSTHGGPWVETSLQHWSHLKLGMECNPDNAESENLRLAEAEVTVEQIIREQAKATNDVIDLIDGMPPTPPPQQHLYEGDEDVSDTHIH